MAVLREAVSPVEVLREEETLVVEVAEKSRHSRVQECRVVEVAGLPRSTVQGYRMEVGVAEVGVRQDRPRRSKVQEYRMEAG